MVRIPSYLISFLTIAILVVAVVISITVTARGGGNDYDSIAGSWKSPDNSRNNWSIIWSCLVTIFICAWTIFHPDITTHTSFVPSRAQWFFVGVFAPEFVAVMAMAQFLRIWALRRNVIRHSSSRESKLQHWSWTQYFYADMGGFVIERQGSPAEHAPGTRDLIQLSLRSIVQLCDNGYSSLFNVSNEQIRDRSKSDSLAKLITVSQVLWFLAQVIGRAIAQVPITIMELVTVAYVATFAFTMVFWWYKPVDINIPILVNVRINDLDQEFFAALPEFEAVHQSDSLEMSLTGRSRSLKPVGFKQSFKQQVSSVSVPVAVDSRVGPYVHFLLVTLLSVVFGVIHLIAFITSFYFNSSTESTLWFVSSLGTTISPPCVYMLYYAPMQHDKPSGVSNVLRYVVLAITGGFYLLSRSYLLVEPFLGLRKVEAGVYHQVRWAQYWPHLH